MVLDIIDLVLAQGSRGRTESRWRRGGGVRGAQYWSTRRARPHRGGMRTGHGSCEQRSETRRNHRCASGPATYILCPLPYTLIPYTLYPLPIPYTVYPIPYTLYSLPSSLHPTTYTTLHPAPYTPHPTPYTLHPHPTPFTLHPSGGMQTGRGSCEQRRGTRRNRRCVYRVTSLPRNIQPHRITMGL